MTEYFKSEYQKELEATITANFTTITASITNINDELDNITDYISAEATADVYTLDLSTQYNFRIDNKDTAGKTLEISNAPTATNTLLNVSIELIFTTTATFTYTGTVTWSVATAPNPTAIGTFLMNLKSYDNGTTWFSSYTGLY